MLKALISEATTPSASAPSYKFAVNSTIVQHLIPSSSLNKPRGGTTDSSEEGASSSAAPATPPTGRRGMHSATAAYWNEKTDGMWSYKFEGGEKKGLDIVIMVIWIAV